MEFQPTRGSTEYLFGVKPSAFSIPLETQAALFQERIDLGQLLLSRLMETHYTNRDNDRIRDVEKAISWSEERLREIQGFMRL